MNESKTMDLLSDAELTGWQDLCTKPEHAINISSMTLGKIVAELQRLRADNATMTKVLRRAALPKPEETPT